MRKWTEAVKEDMRAAGVEEKDTGDGRSGELECAVATQSRDVSFPFFSELCWGKAMVTYTKPQQWKKEESERLRAERDLFIFIFKFIDLAFEIWQVVGLRKARRRQDVPSAACSRDE